MYIYIIIISIIIFIGFLLFYKTIKAKQNIVVIESSKSKLDIVDEISSDEDNNIDQEYDDVEPKLLSKPVGPLSNLIQIAGILGGTLIVGIVMHSIVEQVQNVQNVSGGLWDTGLFLLSVIPVAGVVYILFS